MPLRMRIIGERGASLGPQQSCEFAACGGTIGRAPDNDWAIPDPQRYLSSRHAMIDFQAGAYYLVDMSRNGVYVNGSDTPCGKGNPQRLFDGDRLRMGDYEITVSITGNDENIPDDGMRDSIVRAQLVPEEDSVEMQLVADEKLLQDSVLHRHLSPEPVRPARGTGGAAAAVALPERNPKLEAEREAARRLLTAAGLKPDALDGLPPAATLETTGRLLRTLVAGVMELLHERARVKESLRLPQTMIQNSKNNPLKFAPTPDEALRLLIRDRGETYLAAEASAEDACNDVREHQQVLLRAMCAAVTGYIEQFDPDELRSRFDRELRRPALLASTNRLKYWELYEEAYPTLVHGENGEAPKLFNEELSRAYTEELATRSGDRRR